MCPPPMEIISQEAPSGIPVFGILHTITGTEEVLRLLRRKNDKEIPLSLLKADSLVMSRLLTEIGYFRKGERMSLCGQWIKTLECSSGRKGHHKKFSGTMRCEDRFCMFCMHFEANKKAAQLFSVAHTVIDRYPTYQFLFLTLTIPNVSADDLKDGIDTLLRGWKRLMERKEVSRAVKGACRVVEITYNAKRDEWHPHIHAILVVPSGYFKNYYLKQPRWLELWRESTRIPSITQVDIRGVKDKRDITNEGDIKNESDTHIKLAGVVAELSKYLLKPPKNPKTKENHTYIRKTEEESIRAVEQLLSGLKGRHLVQFSGLLKEIYKELGIERKKFRDIADSGEIGGEESESHCCSVCGKPLVEHLYRWDRGLENYIG